MPISTAHSAAIVGAGQLNPIVETAAGAAESRKRSLLEPVWRQYGLAVLAFAAVSLLSAWLYRWIGYEAIALVYLLSVVLLALFVGRGAILLGTTLTAVGWTYLFAPPRFSFHFGDSYDRMVLATYFFVALTVGRLTARLRAERMAEQEREECARALYVLTRELAGATDRADILTKSTREIARALGREAVLLLPERREAGRLTEAAPGTWQLTEPDQKAAAWVFAHKERVCRQNPMFREAEGCFVPLRSSDSPLGVLGLQWKSPNGPTAQQWSLLEIFAQQIALALERQRLREAESNNQLLEESERLGRTLLNSVSHELRTPISAITGAASSLGGSGALNQDQRKLVAEIDTAAARLNRVVQSLLSAARLQSGQLRATMDWCDIPELVREAVRDVAPLLAGHPVEVHMAANLPLISADFVLLEQALANLLVNAAVHTPPGTPIEIAARAGEMLLTLEVADRGPGLPVDDVEQIFDVFHRARSAKPGGTGLGLAIVKGFVEVQGGSVRAGNREEGGAVFRICLPVAHAPELPEGTT